MSDDSQLSNPDSFEALVSVIQSTSDQLAARAAKAVNISLTFRNWLIGYYIDQYELNGADRATYGEKLLEQLAERLGELGVPTCSKRRLYQYLRFFQTYPQIVRSVTAQFQNLLPADVPHLSETTKVRSAPAQLLESLSYTHIEQLIALYSEEKRDFYDA